MIVLLTVGVSFYLLYGSWQTAVRERLTIDSEALQVAVPTMVVGPEWLSRTAEPRLQLFETLRGHQLIEKNVRYRADVLLSDVLTPFGHTRVLGMPLAGETVEETFVLARGSWPEEAGEALLPAKYRQQGIRVDDVVSVKYFDSFARRVRHQKLVVAGFYEPQGDVVRMPIVDLKWLSELTGFGPNGVILWPKESIGTKRLRRILHDILPATTQVRRPAVSGLVPEKENDTSYRSLFSGHSMLPYAHTVQLTSFDSKLPKQAALRQLTNLSVPMSKLVALILAVVGLGITLGVLEMLFDQQETVGLLGAVGATVQELRRLFSIIFLINVAAALVVGTVVALVVLGQLRSLLELQLCFQWGGLLLWSVGYAALAQWVGHLVSVFVQEVPVSQSLSGRAQPDFWAFIRI
jgi:hypothetical protein